VSLPFQIAVRLRKGRVHGRQGESTEDWKLDAPEVKLPLVRSCPAQHSHHSGLATRCKNRISVNCRYTLHIALRTRRKRAVMKDEGDILDELGEVAAVNTADIERDLWHQVTYSLARCPP